MQLRYLKVAYFSPTGTTRSIARAVARGLAPDVAEEIDITRPAARSRPLTTAGDDTLLVAVPVYLGRVPALLMEWLGAIRADGTPTVCVVVYGNRAYEDALLELKDAVTARGCVPVACAAYIGEHSFSSPETPVAPGRPDEADLAHAEAFGRRVRQKMQAIPAASRVPDLDVPGTRPYRGDTTLWSVDFIAVSDGCDRCGTCAEVCPVGAVDARDGALIDRDECITCCACLKSCPRGARSMKPGQVLDVARKLSELHGEPRRPECFL